MNKYFVILKTYTPKQVQWNHFFRLNILSLLIYVFKYFPFHIPKWEENLRFIKGTEIEKLTGTSNITTGTPCLEKMRYLLYMCVCVNLFVYLC